MVEMKHCVFSAGTRFPQNAKSIKAAKAAVHTLELKNMLDYDCCGQTYYGEFIEIEQSGNISIYAFDDNLTKLIDTCMAFAREKEHYMSLV